MKNTLSMIIVRGLQPVLSFVLVLVIARILGSEIFGKYTIIFSLYFIFQLTSSFGLRILLTREVATQKDSLNKYLTNGVILGFFASLLNIAIMVFVVSLLNYEPDVAKGAYIISVSLLASSFLEIFSGILAGFEEIRKVAYSWILFLVLKTLFSIAVLLAGYGLIALIVVHVLTKFIHSAIGYYYVFRFVVKPKIEIDIQLCKKLLNMAWSLALVTICVSLFWRIDVVMLSKMVENEVVGNYGAAFKIFHFALLVVRSFFLAFFPLLATMFVDRSENFQRACRKAIRYLTVLVIPLGLMVTFFSPQLMPLIWGAKFDGAVVSRVLQVIIWALVPFAITEVFGQALIVSKNQIVHLILNVVVLMIKMLLNYFFILRFGPIGPAVSTIISLSVLGVMQIPFVIPRLISFRVQNALVPLIKIFIASFVMTILIIFLSNISISLGIMIPGIVYFVCLFVLRILSEEDQHRLTKMIRKTTSVS